MANVNGAILLPELLDEVFQLLLDVDGGATLGKCTQVCREWLELCYPLRFRRFKFKVPLTNIEADAVSTETFDGFLHFLRESPRLCSCIAELRLEKKKVATGGVFYCNDLFNPETPPPKMIGLDVDVLWQIISLLPQLRMLDLIVSDLHFPTPLPAYPTFDTSLERLTICNQYNSDCTVPSLEHLQFFLRAFTSVRHLILGRVQAATSSSSLGGRSEKLLVENLTLHANHSSTLAACVDPARLTVLNMRRCMFYQQLDFPYDILGRNVRDLRLAVLGYDSDEKATVDMRHCPNVTSLLIPFMFYLNPQHMRLPEFGYNGWNIACSMLSEAPATLREVVLILNLERGPLTRNVRWAGVQDRFVAQLNRIDWMRLMLAIDKLARLEHLRIQVAARWRCEGRYLQPFVSTLANHALSRISGHQRVRNLLQFELAPHAEREIWAQ